MTKLRAGLIGLGMMGRHHARVLGGLSGVDLVALADPGGDPHGVAGGREVLSGVRDIIDTGVDYCVVAVPTTLHESIGLALAEAGVHTLIEKPLAIDTAAGERLAAAFHSAGLIGGVGHIERFNPALRAARDHLADGRVGRVHQVATRRQGPFPSRIADTGVVMDLASHDIDLTAWVTGSRFTSVSARVAHCSGREHEDMVSMVGTMADGTITNHLVNWLSPLKERVTVITGERGVLVADTLTADLTFYENRDASDRLWDELVQFRGVSEGDAIRYGIRRDEPLRLEHEAFRDAVLGRDSSIATFADGVAAVAVAEAALASARTQQTVALRD